MGIDRLVYDRLLGVLDLVTRGDTDSQRFLNENLNAFESGRNDACIYYLEVSLNSNNFHVRQMSLLLLKRSLSREWQSLTVESKRGLYDGIFQLLGISSAEIRSVVSSCIVTLYGLQSGSDSKVFTHRLLDILSKESPVEVLEASSLALSMIVEDIISFSSDDSNGVASREKFDFLRVELSRSIIQTSTSKPELHRYLSKVLLIMVDSMEVAEYILHHYFDLVWNLLGSISTIQESSAKKFVLKCLLRIWDYRPSSILQALFPIITSSCKDDSDPQVQIEALDLLSHILQSIQYVEGNREMHDIRSEFLTRLRAELPVLIKILVENTKYTSWDYMSMDISHMEDDNASKPDSIQDLPSHTHVSKKLRDSDDDEDLDAAETSTWGNTWTVRKGAALALDNISQAYGGDPEVLAIFLRYIQANLDSPDWEIKESAVLTLGAISRGSLNSLSPFLPKVIEYLVVLSSDSKPLLRIISCWCISRFTHFLFSNTQYLETSLRAILNRMLDTNKRVQEGACSAFTAFEETSGMLLVPYLDYILETVLRAIEIYQERNFRILYDVIGTLAQNVGEPLLNARKFPDLMNRLMDLLASTDIYKPQFLALLECISCVSQIVGDGMSVYATKILQRCLYSIHTIVTDSKDEDLPGPPRWDIVEFASDTISSLVSSLHATPANVCTLLDTCLATDGSGRRFGIVELLLESCKSGLAGVLQSCIALLGDLGWVYSAVLVQPVVHLLTENILHDFPSVANNAVWAIGVLSMHERRSILQPQLQKIVLDLSHILNSESRAYKNLCIIQNVCITLGRICLNFPDSTCTLLPKFAEKFCLNLTSYRNDFDKAQAIQGLALAVTKSPVSAAQHMAGIVQLFLSYPPCDPQFESALREALLAIVRTNGPAWENIHYSIKNGAKVRFFN
ncbi:importin beta/transportin, putative [Theileria equi strain WA]|uniref:Importin beta/transportin, putative n=1 Tax=Theileria equi strain WA TaxID=1537102 RepID=L0B0P0_THEEQ|nr:importin beta/transportin, putative [Theileria equi strain WA]AFZ81078.1 importin beta/transportin, putative [Theileria equi strain WA]|eukprot:XP_004830744.1 importin beta/transportin, putative [Theileria equi strain WA]